jgi:hypothetical protein
MVSTDDGWANRREGGKRASSTHASKAEVRAAGPSSGEEGWRQHLIHKKVDYLDEAMLANYLRGVRRDAIADRALAIWASLP